MKDLKFLVALCFILLSLTLFSQRREVAQNYRKFDRKPVHFGFMLGVNTADFSPHYFPNLASEYNLYSIVNKAQPGFQLGIISSVKLGTPSIRLRFIPSLSFQEKVLEYTYFDEEGLLDTEEERVGSTNLDFPLVLKFRTTRYNNFAAYVLTGAQFSIDLQSKETAAQTPANPFLKIKRDDFQAQVGAGFDFFLPYFKFGIELKLSHGIVNALVPDNTRLSDPIETLYNRVWWISFTFEG